MCKTIQFDIPNYFYYSTNSLVKETHDLRQSKACAVSGANEFLVLVIVLPAIEKSCSHGTEEAGIAK